MKSTVFWLFVLTCFILWMWTNYDFSQGLTLLEALDWKLIGLAFSFNIALLYFRVFKWALILRAMRKKKSSVFNLCLAVFAGCAFNMIIPARAGGLVQAWIIGKKEDIPVSAALGTITLVRIFDTLMLVFLGGAILVIQSLSHTYSSHFTEVFQTMAWVGAALLVTLFFLIWATGKQPSPPHWSQWVLWPIPTRFKQGVQDLVLFFLKGLGSINAPRTLGIGLLLSLGFWLLCGINIYILVQALGLNLPGMLTPYLILLAQVFSMGIPAPANVGPYHAATIGVLSIIGIDPQTGFQSALVMHGVMLSSNTLPGLIYLSMDKTGFSEIVKEIKDVRKHFKK